VTDPNETETIMQIQLQLAKLGAQEYQFNYYPFDPESWVMTYRLPHDPAERRTGGRTIQECIDKAIVIERERK